MATAIAPTEEMTKLIISTTTQHSLEPVALDKMVTTQVTIATPQPQLKKVITLVMVNM